jgi:hypothetical protein
MSWRPTFGARIIEMKRPNLLARKKFFAIHLFTKILSNNILKRYFYGELQRYLSQRCSARIIAGNKFLSKNILNADFTIYIVSKYLCVDMTLCDSQKYFVLI